MKKILTLFYILFFATQCYCQNTAADDAALQLGNYLATSEFEKADTFFKEHYQLFDSTTCDVLTSVINIGLSSKGKTINIDSTTDCIKRVITEFTEHKEVFQSIATEMMPYFNIYISFLTRISDPFYLDIYRLFKEIWPTIDRENSKFYINVLENTSLQAFIEKRYDEAIPILKELIDLKGQGYQLSSKPYVNYAYLGRCYQNAQNEEEAATYYDKALIYFSTNDKIEDLSTYMTVVRNRFEVAYKLSQISHCRELCRLLLDYYDKKNEFIQDYINVSLEMAKIELYAYNTKDGVQYYEQALQLILRSPNYDASSRKDFLEDLYTVYNTRNVSDEDRKFQSEAKVYNINMGNNHAPIVVDDHYVDILSSKIDGIIEEGKIENVKQFVDDIETLANNYSGKHKELQGINLIESAINRCQSNNVKEQEYVKLYSSLGAIYLYLHNVDKALEYHKKANRLYTRNGIYDANYIDNLCYLAEDYLFKKDFAIAKAYLEEAWDKSQSMDALKYEKVVYYHLLQEYSFLYRDLGDEEKALAYNSMMIEDVSENDASGVFKKVHQYARVQLLLYFNQYKEAQNLIDEIGNEYIEKHGGWWTSFETKFFNNDKTCLHDLEKLSEADKEYIIQSYSSLDTSSLKDYWDIYGGNLNMAYSMSLYKFNTPALRTSTYNNLLFTKNFQLEINKYNRAHPNEPISPDIATNIQKSIGNVSMIKEKLKENEVAVEFFFINNRKSYREIEYKYGALILKKDFPEPIFIELCECDLLNKLVYNTFDEAEVYADRIYNINNSTLYKLIWEPLEKVIAPNSKVYVSGCGSSLYINWSALSNGNMRLDELYDIHNVVSTSTILSDKLIQHNYNSTTLFGGIDYDTSLNVMADQAKKYKHDDISEQYAMLRGEDERGSWGKLKYSLEEINNIADYLLGNNLVVNKFTHSDASEEAFKSLSGSSPDIIHISTHGFFYQPYVHSYLSDYSNLYFSNENNDKLNFNGLLFSGANNAWKYNKFQDHVEDGILTAKEIYSLNLSNTDLLILSACQTGLGENNDVDGNEGLLRAFKVAGVNQLIITLWNISDDATSSIMKDFYKNLLEKKNPKEALKTTINKAKKEMPDPYYWAPFILIE